MKLTLHACIFLFSLLIPLCATLSAQTCIPNNAQGSLYKINMSGYTPNASFSRQGDMLIRPTIVGAGGVNFNNGVNQRDIGIVSGFPAGLPEAGALWFFSNSAMCQYMNTGCNSIQSNAALDVTFTQINESSGYLRYTLDGVIYGNVGAGNALAAELNTFTATNNFISGQIFQVIQGTIEIYFNNNGQSVSGTIDLQGVNANSIGTSYMYCSFDGYCLNNSCGCSTSGGGGNLPTCSGNTNLTSCSGSFEDGSSSGLYSNNLNCSWTIAPPGANSVSLQFSTFSTEAGYDKVFVYDGSATTGTLLGTFSGTQLPSQVLTASSGIMTVVFTSDGSQQGGGWSTNYWCSTASTCSGVTNVSSCTGTITDGSGANEYYNNLNCSWLINPPGATSISLDFESFETESGYDFVRVYNGSNSSAPLIGTFSGNTIPHRLSANSGKMYIEFSTDHSITKAGWSASYACYNNTTPAPFCSNGNILTNCTGTISDGSGSDSYVGNQDCSWLIEPPGATSVTLSFNEFNTEFDYDFVEIYNGSSTAYPLIGVFSGTLLPPVVTANSGKMFIRFFSDYSIHGSGWSATYTCGGLSPCLDPTNLQNFGILGYSYFAMKWDSMPGAMTYRMRMRPANGQWQEYNTTTIGTMTGFYNRIPDTTYEFQVKTRCSSNQESNWCPPVFITTLGAGDPYCFSYGYSFFHWIKRVQIKEIDNITNNNRGYQNFTPLSANLFKGQSYPFSLEAGSSSPTDTLLNWRIWIDLNHNNNFDDIGELMYQGSGNLNQTVTGVLNVPSNALTGQTRMRVSMSTTSLDSPCQNNTRMDVEDYGIQILNMEAPSAAFTENNTCAPVGSSVSFESQSPGAVSFNWSFPGGMPATSSSPSPVVHYDTPGVYGVNLTVSNPAGSNSLQKSNLITVYDPVEIVPTIIDSIICAGESILLQVEGGAPGMNFFWTGSGISNPQSASTVAILNEPGIENYLVTGFLNNCSSIDSISLYVKASDSLNVDLAVSGCPGPELTFSVTQLPISLSAYPQWYVNGSWVASGIDFSSSNLSNGDQIQFVIPADSLPDCTIASALQSLPLMVSCLTVSSTQSEEANILFLVAPNPNQGDFWVEVQSKRTETAQLYLTNSLGVCVHKTTLPLVQGKNTTKINLTDLPSGCYFLTLELQNTFSQRLLIIN